MTYVTSQDIDLEIRKLWMILKRRWQLGLAIIIVSIILSVIASTQQKPRYTANGKLLFKNSDTSNLTGIDTNLDNFESLEQNANPVVTEIEVIKSIPIAQKVISELKLIDSEGKLLKPSKFIAKLDVKPLSGTDVVMISYSDSDPDMVLNVINLLMEKYIQNSLYVNRENVIVADQIINNQLPKAQAKLLEQEEALQRFQEKYNVSFVDEKSKADIENLRSLEQEIQSTEAELQEVEANSVELQQQVSMSPQQAIAWNKLSQSPIIQKQISDLQEAQSKLLEEQERFNEGHPRITALKDQVFALETSIQQQIPQQSAGGTTQLSINDIQIAERENLPQQLTSSLAETEVRRIGLSEKLNKLKSIQNNYQNDLAEMPQLQNKYGNLKLKLESAQSRYKFLLEKAQELNLAKQQNFDKVRIIEPAQIDDSNIYASSIMLVGFGVSFGIVAAILTMTSLDIVDKFIKSPEEIRKIFNYKLIGVIPNFEKSLESLDSAKKLDSAQYDALPETHNQSGILVHQSTSPHDKNHQLAVLPVKDIPHSPVSKAFWMLQAKFKHYNKANTEQKMIVVSSSLRGEGKSLVSANLALTLSQLGHKVLIIDGDLYKSSQSILWKISNSLGLSNVIEDEGILDSAITNVNDNLDLLPSGQIGLESNPLTIIDSTKMKFLLWKLVEKYNFVIIDSPPLLEVPDAITLGNLADGMILVSRLGVLDYASAQECRELLESTGQNILGLVINGVTKGKSDVYGYGYGYGMSDKDIAA